MKNPEPASQNATIIHDVEAVNRIHGIEMILRVLRETTGLRIALVARITPDSWTACAVLDDAGFGLKPGDNLELANTY